MTNNESSIQIQKYAAIDIGSNAMRLLLTMVLIHNKEVEFKKIDLFRLPIRLGQDAFSAQKIEEKTLKRFIDGMMAFKLLMKIHEVDDYRAVATSAMREAKNGQEIVKEIFQKTGVQIDIINGKSEAEIIFDAHFKNNLFDDSCYVYVDVGGGSTEITILKRKKILASKSFKIGSIRMLNNLVSSAYWEEMKEWVKVQTKYLDHVELIGSGGSINKLYKIMEKGYPSPILYQEFKLMRKILEKMSVDQRIVTFKLNPDRADVIVPALKIYYSVMKWADASVLHVPKIGLSDGIIQNLFQENNPQDI